jgi:hypothetical protein
VDKAKMTAAQTKAGKKGYSRKEFQLTFGGR